tara:strand:+ start:1899 stop:2093 length:195 start_codon:yes stop_codon:yes gene_type:complete
MQTETKPDVTTLTQWPPLAHIARGRDPKEGDEALCGAKLLGIKLDDASEVCEECARIFREESGA